MHRRSIGSFPVVTAVLALLTFSALLGMAGCTSSSTGTTTATSASAVSSGSGVSISGKDLAITLDENPTTGYSWAYTMSGVGLNSSGDAYTAASNPDNLDGVGGTHEYRFTGSGFGTTTITFTYAQQWDGGEVAQSVAYNVQTASDGSILSCEKTAANTGQKDVPAAGATFDGANLQIALAENPTTGYTWAYTLSSACVEPASDTYFTAAASASASSSASSGTSASTSASVSASASSTSSASSTVSSVSDIVLGAGGIHEYDFTGVSAGTCDITFSLARVAGGIVSEQYVYTVTVGDDGTISDCTLKSHKVLDSSDNLVDASGSASASASASSSTSASASASASTSASASKSASL